MEVASADATGALAPAARRALRRNGPTRGPRPVRPRVAPVAVRPAVLPPSPPGRAAQRMLGRPCAGGGRGSAAPCRPSTTRYRLRRAVAASVLAGASAGVVVGLGSLADAAGDASARSTVPALTAEVAVRAGDTVWDVARRSAPAADASAVVERIVADNGLATAALRPGQVLRVPVG
ncbi:LysM peptidoglycan-binding domain-containing protein [Pseudonocardia sp. H11422]|uniref:LysM peptidoglycan-binding domain-containing protein n=1 Tax=Pseudonocardia sp. H11422 TaxID=2835866 RepID=UPI00292FA883|nr:LysM peptidoglycan-binding domain-containing protein [Pseudonocardia sp. H11422]